MAELNTDLLASWRQAIQDGLGAYLRQSGLTKVIVGCSGGLDSALTLALAAEAIGPKNVVAITMPSAFSSPESVTDSKSLCQNLGVTLYERSIEVMVDQLSHEMVPLLGTPTSGVALENLQARVRGLVLMTYSNTHGGLVLSCSNKSEIMVGYCTLYGDTCGGLNLIGDLYKTEVFALARHINECAGKPIIPEAILTKAPSAELAPDQRDEDTLPSYDLLDAALQTLVEGESEAQVAAAYLEARLPRPVRAMLLSRAQSLVDQSAFKRAQLPPAIPVRTNELGQNTTQNKGSA